MKEKIKSIAFKNVYLVWSALFLWLCFQLAYPGLILMSRLYVNYTSQLFGSVAEGLWFSCWTILSSSSPH